jgi:hypothetical protein
MGIAPPDVKRMSMWEMAAVTDRWIEAHDTEGKSEKGGRLSEDEKDEIWAWMKAEGHVRKKGNGAGTR